MPSPKRNEEIINKIKKEELGIKKFEDYSQEEQRIYDKYNSRYSLYTPQQVDNMYESALDKARRKGFMNIENASGQIKFEETKKAQEKIDEEVNKVDKYHLRNKRLAELQAAKEKNSNIIGNFEEFWESYVMDHADNNKIVNVGDADSLYEQIKEEAQKRDERNKSDLGDSFVPSEATETNFVLNTFHDNELRNKIDEFYKAKREFDKDSLEYEKLSSEVEEELEIDPSNNQQLLKDKTSDNLRINDELAEKNKIYETEEIKNIEEQRDKNIADKIQKVTDNFNKVRNTKTNGNLTLADNLEELRVYSRMRLSMSTKKDDMVEDKWSKNYLENAWKTLNSKQAEYDKLNGWQKFWAGVLPAAMYGKAALLQDIEQRKIVMTDLGYTDQDITDKYTEYKESVEQEKAAEEKIVADAKEKREAEIAHGKDLEKKGKERMQELKENYIEEDKSKDEVNEPVNEKKNYVNDLTKILREDLSEKTGKDFTSENKGVQNKVHANEKSQKGPSMNNN